MVILSDSHLFQLKCTLLFTLNWIIIILHYCHLIFLEDCPAVTDVHNKMSVTVTLENVSKPFEEMGSKHNKYSAMLNATCSEYYQLVGNLTVTCLSTGNWSHDIPTCISELDTVDKVSGTCVL